MKKEVREIKKVHVKAHDRKWPKRPVQKIKPKKKTNSSIRATVVTHRKAEPTGKTKVKKDKWDGTCFSCKNATKKKNWCQKFGHAPTVRKPDLYCESWR